MDDRAELVPQIVLYRGATPPAKEDDRYEVRVLSFTGNGIKGVRIQPVYRWRLPQKEETTNQDGLCSVSVASSVLHLSIKTDDIWIAVPRESLTFPVTVFLRDPPDDPKQNQAATQGNTDDIVAKSGQRLEKLVAVRSGQTALKRDSIQGTIRILDTSGAAIEDIAVEVGYVSVRERTRFHTDKEGIASVQVGTGVGTMMVELRAARVYFRPNSIRLPMEVSVARSGKR